MKTLKCTPWLALLEVGRPKDIDEAWDWADCDCAFWLCGKGMIEAYPELKDATKNTSIRLWGCDTKEEAMWPRPWDCDTKEETDQVLHEASHGIDNEDTGEEIDWEVTGTGVDAVSRYVDYARWLESFETDPVYVWLEVKHEG